MDTKLIFPVLFVLINIFDCGYSELHTIKFKPWMHASDTLVYYSAETNYTGDKGIQLNADKSFDSPELVLVDTVISSFPRNVFEVFTNLTEIHMKECGIKSLRRSDFVGGSNVEKLDLSDNKISELPSEAFIHLEALKYLYMANNPVTMLNADTFAGLAKLEELYMSNTLINSLPVGLLKPLPMLEFLVLSSNNISEFPEETFSNNFNLRRLSIRNCSTKILHPKALAHLNMLWLDIGENEFETPIYLPPAMYVKAQNANITELYLNGTCKALYAQNNHLTTIVSNDLSEMTQLRLENNSIIDISFLKNMGQLDELGLSGNPIPQTSLTKEFFDDKEDLRFLYLKEMNLTDLLPGIFDSLTRMYHIDLSHNKFTHLSIEYFKPLKNLVELDLRGNPLEEFDVDGLNAAGVDAWILGTIDDQYRYCRYAVGTLTYSKELINHLQIKITPADIERCENLLKKSSENKEMLNHNSQ